jgi:photoactive yellow protein
VHRAADTSLNLWLFVSWPIMMVTGPCRLGSAVDKPAGAGMGLEKIAFDAPDLADRIEQLTQHELDTLPFGVILLKRDGTVMFYSQAEADQSGYGKIPIGANMFELSACLGGDEFQGRITRALKQGPVDLSFEWRGDFADPERMLRFRVQSSKTNGFWIFVSRDAAAKR